MSYDLTCHCSTTCPPCSFCESLSEHEVDLLDRYGHELSETIIADHRNELADEPTIEQERGCECRWCTGAVKKLACNCSRSWVLIKGLKSVFLQTGQMGETLETAIEVAERMRCGGQANGRCACPWCLVFGADLRREIYRHHIQKLETAREAARQADAAKVRSRQRAEAALWPQQSTVSRPHPQPRVLPAFTKQGPAAKPQPVAPPPSVPTLAADRWELLELGPADGTPATYEPDDRWAVLDLPGER